MPRPKRIRIDDFSLWPHQKEAIATAQSYVKKYTGAGCGGALVHLPTGAGKSGVIAILARIIPGIEDVLILTPRTSLRDQLGRDIESRFFQRLRKSPPVAELPKQVRILNAEPGDIGQLPSTPCVFVTTIQSWYSWHKRQRPIATRLLSRAQLVVIDEGHCEPAPCWRESIRAFDRPRVLCSATPYRNDLKIFDINFDHAYCFGHGQAVGEGFLRELEIVPRARCDDVGAFVDDILAFYDSQVGKRHGDRDTPRVIIRCENHEQIRQIAAGLIGRGRTCVAIHEQFATDPAVAIPSDFAAWCRTQHHRSIRVN